MSDSVGTASELVEIDDPAGTYRELVVRMGRFLALSAAGPAFVDGLSLPEWIVLGSLDDPATEQLDSVQRAISVGMSIKRLGETGRRLRKRGFITHEADVVKITDSGRAAKQASDLAIAAWLKPSLPKRSEALLQTLRFVREVSALHSQVEPMV